MANLFIRTYTFVDGTTAYGSQVEAEIGNIVTVLNNLNTAATNWGQVSALNAVSVPLISDCAAGSQHIADFKNNSVIKASIDSAGKLTCVGAALGSAKATGLASATASGDAISWGQAFTSGTITFSPTTSGIKGTTTNDSTTAGNVGEYVESVIADVAFPSTGTYGDATSIVLTAGDWEVSAQWQFVGNGATFGADANIGISQTTGNSSTGLVVGSNRYTFTWINQQYSGSLSGYRQSLSTGTTIYLKYNAGFTTAAPHIYARLSARRLR